MIYWDSSGAGRDTQTEALPAIAQPPENVTFNDLITVIEAFGFVRDRVRGSHHVYKHPDVPDRFLVLQPDQNGQAKPYQVRQFLSLVEEYRLGMTQMTGDERDVE